MIVDLTGYDGPEEMSCDLCIAGSGAAGLAIAAEFLGKPTKVLVLEGGGLEFTGESQDLYVGQAIGMPYQDLDVARLRYFGGSTNHWEGMCQPLEPLDFEQRAWVPHSGWPIGIADLAPYLQRATAVLEVGDAQFDPDQAPPPSGSYLPFDPELIVTRLWALSPPVRLGEKYHDALAASDNVDVLLHAHLTGIALHDDLRATRAFTVTTEDGRRLEVRAGTFVLALGALENARLLLNSNRQIPPGVGNENDLVGRFFLEHPHVDTGQLVVDDPAAFEATYGRFERPGASPIWPGMALAPAAQVEHGRLGCRISTWPVPAYAAEPGYQALRDLPASLMERDFAAAADHVRRIVTNFGGTSRSIYQRLTGTAGVGYFHLLTMAEQSPDPESRVLLSDQTDRLGLRRIALDWRLSAFDKDSIRLAHELLAREVGRLGVGRLHLAEWLQDESDAWDASLRGGNHHMGTTRMADDPRQGVVDRNCRVHRLANLYIAGSSVYPTGGAVNPTLTIVQLALRLADHLEAMA
jgi:choline dehydrogenase-like flavoprotein